MDTREQGTSRPSTLAVAAASFGLNKRFIETEAQPHRVGELAAALREALLDLQTHKPEGTARANWVPESSPPAGPSSNADAVTQKEGDFKDFGVTEREGGAVGLNYGEGEENSSDNAARQESEVIVLKKAVYEPPELTRIYRTESSSDVDIDIELSSSTSDHSGDVANKGTSTTGLGETGGGTEEGEGEGATTNWSASLLVLVVGYEKRVLLAHKEIFASRCPQGVEALGLETKEASEGQLLGQTPVQLPDFTPPGIWACLEYLYTAGVRFRADHVWGVLQASIYFGLDDIAKACVKVVLENVTDSCTWAMLEGGLILGSEVLANAALNLVAEKTQTILSCTDFSLPSTTSAALLRVVQRGDLTIYEKDLAKMVMVQWAENTKESKEAVDKVMRHISWPQVYEEDMGLLSLGMRKRLLPEDVMSEVLKWVGGPPKVEKIPNSMKIRYRNWTFLLRHPRCPPSKYKDVPPPELVNKQATEHVTGNARWIEALELPSPFGVHVEGGDHAIVRDTYGRLNATKSFSVEAWVKLDGPQVQNSDNLGGIVSKHGPGSGWELRCSHEKVQFMVTLRCNQGQGMNSDWHEVVEINYAEGGENTAEWHHFAGTFDGKMAMVYVDGQSSGFKRVINNVLGSDRKIHEDVEIVHYFGHMCIGCNPHWGDRYLTGDICGVKIYNDKVFSEGELGHRTG